MPTATNFTLFSGGAQGAEAEFGRQAERYGVAEVNFTFEGHRIDRTRGIRVLTSEELEKKDVSLTYVSKLLGRKFSNGPQIRMVLRTIMHQVDAGLEVFVVGAIQDDGTVKGGTGWGAEFAKICNKPLHVFCQEKQAWFSWEHGAWKAGGEPVITHTHFTGTGTRFPNEAGLAAIDGLFKRTFG